MSGLLSLSNSRPVQAEGLFYGLRCSVGKLLGRPCPPTVAPTTQPPPTPAPSQGTDTDTDKNKQDDSKPQPASGGTMPTPTTSSPPSSPPPQPSSANVQQVVTPAPIELDEELLEEVPKITSLQATDAGYTFPAHVSPLIQSGGNSAVLGQTTSAVEASEDGWTVFGVSWVWCLAGGISLIAGLYAGKRVLTGRKNIKLAKS